MRSRVSAVSCLDLRILESPSLLDVIKPPKMRPLPNFLTAWDVYHVPPPYRKRSPSVHPTCSSRIEMTAGTLPCPRASEERRTVSVGVAAGETALADHPLLAKPALKKNPADDGPIVAIQ